MSAVIIIRIPFSFHVCTFMYESTKHAFFYLVPTFTPHYIIMVKHNYVFMACSSMTCSMKYFSHKNMCSSQPD